MRAYGVLLLDRSEPISQKYCTSLSPLVLDIDYMLGTSTYCCYGSHVADLYTLRKLSHWRMKPHNQGGMILTAHIASLNDTVPQAALSPSCSSYKPECTQSGIGMGKIVF